MKHRIISWGTVLLSLFSPLAYAQNAPNGTGNLNQGGYGYLYCHMSDRGEWTAYALSRDGMHFHDLINGDSIFSACQHAGIEGGTRDAYICRTPDGNGYRMVTTDMKTANKLKIGKKEVWDNYGIDLHCSGDLIHWTSKTLDFRQGGKIFCDLASPDVYQDWTQVNRVWAPQLFWDDSYHWPDGEKGAYFMYFSMWNRQEEPYDRMYYSYVDVNMERVTKPRLLFDWGYATIDADINYLHSDGLYHMMIKKEGGKPGLFTSTAPSLTGPWSLPLDDDYVSFEGNKKCEGVSAFQLAGDSTWRIGYIEYSSRPKNYRICQADSRMRHFSKPQNIEGVNGPQHGSFLRITREEYERLQAWSDAEEGHHLQANAANPVIDGYFADPEILYCRQDGRYYLYPTTDGNEGWRNHDAKVFVSDDLKHWKDGGVIFDLGPDCVWADDCLWAPCIIERKYVRGKPAVKPKDLTRSGKAVSYRYFYYFVGNGKIGVAVADHPTGPFKDALGHPLLDSRPQGQKGGQVIDPDVFQDPESGKYYLYWGNGFLAVSELNDDMISIREGSTRILIDRNDKARYHYNEGCYVFYRNGLYYFSWSENDTRSANYRVRYLISDSPTAFVRNGEAAMPEAQVLLQQNPSMQVYGTGHHSVLYDPKDDRWLMVYHRFARPEAIKKGWSAGYFREICIDSLEFNSDGSLQAVRLSY